MRDAAGQRLRRDSDLRVVTQGGGRAPPPTSQPRTWSAPEASPGQPCRFLSHGPSAPHQPPLPPRKPTCLGRVSGLLLSRGPAQPEPSVPRLPSRAAVWCLCASGFSL